MTTQEDDHGYAYDHTVTAVSTTSLWSQSKGKVRRIKRRLAIESFLFPGLLYGISQVVSNHEFKQRVVSLGRTLHSYSTSLHPGVKMRTGQFNVSGLRAANC